MHELSESAIGDVNSVSRRGFLKGVMGLGVAAGIGSLAGGGFFFEDAYAATVSPPTTTVALPTTTAPEQLHLTWGTDPSTSVTVSWAAPGTVAQPAPQLAFSTAPITPANPGTVVTLPAAQPLDVTQDLPAAAAVSFTDGLNSVTTFHYHVQLSALTPATTYYYQVSDGASSPAVLNASFVTAPAGRVPFRFSSYGDLATPSLDLSASGNVWHESSDNSYFAVSAIESPGDGGPAPLFHLLNGDLCYANLDINNQPQVWRDFGVNIARSAANRPWMPALGNHETEFGICNHRGVATTGAIAAAAASGDYWNGPYGYGSYLSRFVLPDNGLTNSDGNHLRGNFYSFQVGTVLFISLDADDVIYQDGASFYASSSTTAPETTTSGASIPNGTSTYNNQYSGALVADPANDSLVPDPSSPTPNLQTAWLASTLATARANSAIDMIVVQMHQCALTTSSTGNGCDLGIRQAWLPLFDQYQVDLVLSGHEHDYERSYPVRGYDPGSLGTVVAPNPGQTTGAAVNTRRPTVATTEPSTVDGLPAYNTSQGTVFLVLGGGGTNGPTNNSSAPGFYGYNSSTALPRAKVITQRNAIVSTGPGLYSKNGADSVEDAPWSAGRDTSDAYGYAIFDVDPGAGPGDTTITMRYFHIPAVSGGSQPWEGTTTLPSTPYETFVFGRQVPNGPSPQLPEFAVPALALGSAAVVGAAAVALQRRSSPSEAGRATM